jgi:hypothetical protein
MTKWRYFAGRAFPRVVRELELPAARTVRDPNLTRCPLHGDELGPTTRMCLTCFETAWAEVGRRYREAGHPGQKGEPMQHEPKPTGMTTEIVPVEGELVGTDGDDERPSLPATLFGSDPELALARIVKVADELARTIRSQKLTASISGKEHVLVEGWTLLGTLLGVFPVLVWTHKLEDGWEARVEARTLDGRIVGAAESECLRSERRWAKADDYAVRSMAATRATSKALRQPLGFVMSLAGFEATPVEELPPDEDAAPQGPIPDAVKPSAEQTEQLQALLRELEQFDPDTDWKVRARELAGVPWKLVTRTVAERVIEKLQAELAAPAGARTGTDG